MDEANPELVSTCTLAVTILPPWWLSWWATLIYVILGIAALYFGLRLAFFMIKMKNDIYIEQKVSEMKIKFFTNISHELRTPLTLIKGPIQELREREKLSPKGLQYVDLMEKNTNQMLQLVNQILDFRKIQNGKMRLHVSLIDFNEMIASFQKEFRVLSEENEISFTFQLPDEPIMVWADKEKMSIVIRNIISNAFKFTPQGGHVTLKAYPEPSDGREMAVIQVEDDGIGIPTEEQTHIFERFHQASSHKGNTGSGIGLNVAKEYVQMHHGKINVSSSPGKGSCFTVRIPVGNISHVPSPLLPTAPQQGNPMDNPPLPVDYTVLPKILLVEDNNDFRHYLQEELRRHFVVFEASDGEEGEAVALQQKPDIIITDLMMPKMDGIELCKRIKHNIDVSHIPIILLTASASMENEERGYKEGADAYMTKPFKWEILTARIHNLLAQRRQQQNEFKQNAEVEAKDVTISPADEDFLNKALRFVEKNMDNSEYSVDELSDDMAMSRATLFRKMRSVIGMSPTDFIRNTRLKRAAQLITEGRLSVTEIAYSVGYSSPGHFTKSFKKEFGVLPTQYHKT